jgi:hypothetical protein
MVFEAGITETNTLAQSSLETSFLGDGGLFGSDRLPVVGSEINVWRGLRSDWGLNLERSAIESIDRTEISQIASDSLTGLDSETPLVSASATTKTYYIAPNGSDINSGTLDRPLATIQKAHDLAHPGDTIYLRGGTYILPKNKPIDNYDPLEYGQDADGLAIKFGSGKGNVIRGVRSFANSDDGINLWEFRSPVLIENSWAYGNGRDRWRVGTKFAGNGNGYKLGGGEDPIPAVNHIVRNSLAFNNDSENYQFKWGNHVLRNNISIGDFEKLQHNFAKVYVTRPADLFDDWSVTIENFQNLAKVLQDIGFISNTEILHLISNGLVLKGVRGWGVGVRDKNVSLRY